MKRNYFLREPNFISSYRAEKRHYNRNSLGPKTKTKTHYLENSGRVLTQRKKEKRDDDATNLCFGDFPRPPETEQGPTPKRSQNKRFGRNTNAVVSFRGRARKGDSTAQRPRQKKQRQTKLTTQQRPSSEHQSEAP